MVSAGEYGAIAQPRVRTPVQEPAPSSMRAVGFKVMGMVALAVVAVVAVASLSDHMGEVRRAELVQQELHRSTAQDFDVADAILSSAGVHDKKGSISASMAALAAQAAQEKETGQLSATVSLPQIPKSIAKMAAEAKHEIMIEENVDKRQEAIKAAAKAAAKAKLAKKRAAAKAATAKAAKETSKAIKVKETYSVASKPVHAKIATAAKK